MTTSHVVPLKLGISDLDSLIEPPSSAEHEPMKDPWQATFVGPDGSGKSILALHLASRFAALSARGIAKVIYISTDLSFSQAKKTWSDFRLGKPRSREELLHKHYPFSTPSGASHLRDSLELIPVQPDSEVDLAKVLSQSSEKPGIYFVDLQKSTTGDDWSFLNKLVGLLAQPEADCGPYEKHLLIIDAIEGLETVVGDRDSFGQRRSRRSRIAQLIRTCMSRQCVHLAMVIEEPRPGLKLPEQFVADLVLRVRQTRSNDYLLRTIEVEKCRGVAHVRGQHEFHIRTGRGTRTGKLENPDDPEVKCVQDAKPQFMSHVKVIPTLHHWNRLVREDDSDLLQTRGEATFGVDQLDRFFQRSDPPANAEAFPPASLTLLLGDAGTYKSRLARSFLAHGFSPRVDPLGVAQTVLISSGWDDRSNLWNRLCKHQESRVLQTYGRSFCRRISIRHVTGAHFLEIVESAIHHAQLRLLILNAALGSDEDVTMSNSQAELFKIHKSALALVFDRLDKVDNQDFSLEGGKSDKDIDQEVESELHNIPSSERTAIEVGLRALRTRILQKYFDPTSVFSKVRWKKSALIRVAVDDWSLLLASHPSLASDPLVLQSLLALLRREGVSALIASTQSGQPLLPTLELDPQDLRKLDFGQIYTWNVPFFGQKRTAVTVLSSGGVKHPEVLELRSDGVERERIQVDPHFALYAGLEEGNPRRIPLVVRLYMGDHAKDSGIHNAPAFPRIMRHTLTQLFPSTPDSDVVRFEGFQEYDDFFTFTDWLDDSRVDHTLVFQIDEFWSSGKPSLLNLHDYWETKVGTRPTINDKWSNYKDGNGDPYGVFVPVAATAASEPGRSPVPSISRHYVDLDGDVTKQAFFSSPEDGGPKCEKLIDGSKRVDRVPFLWDFGMILARRDLWMRCADMEVEVLEFISDFYPDGRKTKNESKATIKDIWNGLCLKDDRIGGEGDWKSDSPTVTWSQFLSACSIVSSQNQVGSFSVDLRTAESLSSLLLELWGSLDRQMGQIEEQESPFERLAVRDSEIAISLKKLLFDRPLSLFLACCQLLSSCGHLQSKYRQIEPHSSEGTFVAKREWYSTSASIMRGEEIHAYSVLSLPGTFSTRGDWSLAVAKGSRSELLAHRALDLLCSRQMNIVRLHDGLGLPTRDLAPELDAGRLQSALTRIKDGTNVREYLWYESVCRLGANPPDFAERRESKRDFTWLWRSQILFYQRDCFFLRRWTSRLFEERAHWFDFSYGTRKGREKINRYFQMFHTDAVDPATKKWQQFRQAEAMRSDFHALKKLQQILKLDPELHQLLKDEKLDLNDQRLSPQQRALFTAYHKKFWRNDPAEEEIVMKFLKHFDDFCEKRDLLAAMLDDEYS